MIGPQEDKEELIDRAPVLVDTAEELRLEREDQELKLADHKLAEEKAKKEKSEEVTCIHVHWYSLCYEG
jgi:hypothetical protein